MLLTKFFDAEASIVIFALQFFSYFFNLTKADVLFLKSCVFSTVVFVSVSYRLKKKLF